MASKDKFPQIRKNNSFFQSLWHAVSGLVFAFKHEKNLKRHLVIAVLVLALALVLAVPKTELLWLLAVIFIVFISELWNTAVEYIVDLLVQKQFDPLAKRIKDVSAAIVLTAALLAVVVGVIIFGPHLLHLVTSR